MLYKIEDKDKSKKKPSWKAIIAIAILSMACLSGLLIFSAGLTAGRMIFHNKTCDYWHPDMTSTEKIRAALELTNKSRKVPFVIDPGKDGEERYFSMHQLPYKDVDTILKLFPDCCTIHSALQDAVKHSMNQADSTSRASLPEGTEGTVSLRFIGQNLDKSTGEVTKKTIQRFIDFNKCKQG